VDAEAARDETFLWTPPLVPGRLAVALTIIAALWSCWIVSSPGEEAGFYSFIALYCVWLTLGLMWLVRAVVGVLAGLVLLARRQPVDPRLVLRFTAQPLIVLAVWLLVDTDIPLRARFEVSRGSFEHHAAAILAGRESPRSVHAARAYSILRVEREGSTVTFFTNDAGSGAASGFAYVPGRAPKSQEYRSYRHLSGPWYVWSTGAD